MDAQLRATPNDLMGAAIRKRFPGHGWFMGRVTGWSEARDLYS
jgi:hypothetical protein